MSNKSLDSSINDNHTTKIHSSWSNRRNRRRHVQLSNGWSVVGSVTSSHLNSHASNLLQDTSNVIVQSTISAEKLHREFTVYQCKLQSSSLLTWIRNQVSYTTDIEIKYAMCIGSGSFSLDWSNRQRSMWQLALFLKLVELITFKSSSTTSITLYAQDPQYSSVDTDFLTSLGISVLQAEAFHTSDNSTINISASKLYHQFHKSTLFFAPFLPWEVLIPEFFTSFNPLDQSLIPSIYRPAIFIGCRIIDSHPVVKTSLSYALKHQSSLLHKLIQKSLLQSNHQSFPIDLPSDNNTLVRFTENCSYIAQHFEDGLSVKTYPEFDLHQTAFSGLCMAYAC